MIEVSFGSLFATDGFYRVFDCRLCRWRRAWFLWLRKRADSSSCSRTVFVGNFGAHGLNSYGCIWAPFSRSQSTSRCTQARFTAAGGCHDFGVSSGALAFDAHGSGDISLSAFDHGAFFLASLLLGLR